MTVASGVGDRAVLDPAPRIAVLTISDGVSAGTRTDTSGAAVVAWIERRGNIVAAHDVVADATDVVDIARGGHRPLDQRDVVGPGRQPDEDGHDGERGEVAI